MISLEELHDATLVGLEVSWASGELRCRFDVGISETTIIQLLAHGLTFLKCPKQHPWGPSIYVKEVRVDKLENGSLLVIQMQSGDLIEANVENVILE